MTGLELKQKRENKGWSQEKLAEIAGVTKRTVINWEQSETLSGSKVKLLQSVFNEVEYNTNDDTVSDLSEQELKELAYKAVMNEEALMKIKAFRNMIEIGVAKKIQLLLSNEEEFKKWRNS